MEDRLSKDKRTFNSSLDEDTAVTTDKEAIIASVVYSTMLSVVHTTVFARV
jgi:hypothetical protein